MAIRLPDGATLDARWLTERFSRSGGPGGQNVNKVASRVELRFQLACDQLPPGVRARLEQRSPSRVTKDGDFQVLADETRDQLRNRELAEERLAELLAAAWYPPRPRRPTRPTRGSKERRLESKRVRSAVKRDRTRPGEG